MRLVTIITLLGVGAEATAPVRKQHLRAPRNVADSTSVELIESQTTTSLWAGLWTLLHPPHKPHHDDSSGSGSGGSSSGSSGSSSSSGGSTSSGGSSTSSSTGGSDVSGMSDGTDGTTSGQSPSDSSSKNGIMGAVGASTNSMIAFIVAAAVLGALVAGVAVRRAKKRNAKNHPLRGGVTRRIGMFERMSNKVKNLGKNKNRPDRVVEMPTPRNMSETPGGDEYVRA